MVVAKEKKPGNRANIAALIAVAVLTAALLWVAMTIVAHNKLQNCIDSGRRNCDAVANGETP